MTTVTNPPLRTRIEELGFVRDVSAWLASQSMPANGIVGRQNWETAIMVDNVVSLRTLVLDLAAGEYAGLTSNGSCGPWAQVRAHEDRGEHVSGWPFELHLHNWSLGVPDGVWKLLDHDISQVAAHLWNWVVKSTPPDELPEPTTHPRPGKSFW